MIYHDLSVNVSQFVLSACGIHIHFLFKCYFDIKEAPERCQSGKW